MKKLSRYFILIILVLLLMNCNDVNALDKYYENSRGVSLTKDEYDFLSLMYWEGYQEFITMDDYKNIIDSGIMNGTIDVKIVDSNETGITPLSDYFSNQNKELKIVKSCSSTCTISVTLKWKSNPTIRSYDVIGAYIEDTSFVGTPTTTVANADSMSVISDLKKTSSGIGSSFKLPSGTDLVINQVYRVNKGGHVYASYQHAAKTSSLSISKDYTFSKTGYGRVFSFSSQAKDYYDGMTGVDISV